MAVDPSALFVVALKSLVWAGGVLLAVGLLGKGEGERRRFLALAGLWLLPLVLSVSTEQVPLAAGRAISAVEMAERAPVSLLHLGAGIWLAGSVLGLALVMGRLFGVRRLLGRASPCRRSKAHEGIPVLLSADVVGPCLAGWWKPRILMPVESLGWREEHWTAALDHEAEHARRGDGWHRLFLSLVRALWWWNPAIRRLIKIYEVESECLCDAAAVRHCGAIDYGRFLLATAGHPASAGMVASMSGGVLHQRVERLVSPAGRRGKGPCAAMVGAVLVLAGIGGICASLGTSRPEHHAAPVNETRPDGVAEEARLRWDADPFPEP